jgi:type VI secretion system Hcp family effector
MNKKLLTIAIVLVILAMVIAPATAAQIGYIKIPGITNGCSGGKGLDGYCKINGFQQEVKITGDCHIGPCRSALSLGISKPLDAASPMFLNAAASGINMPKVTIRIPQLGSSSSFYVIVLYDVWIIDDIQSFDPLSPTQSAIGPLEAINFEFGKITWKWEPNIPLCWDVERNMECTPSVENT